MSFPNSYCKQTQAEVDAVVAEAAENDQLLAVGVTDGSGFACNALRWHPTPEGLAKAADYASDLFSRWMAAKEWRIEAKAKEGHFTIKE